MEVERRVASFPPCALVVMGVSGCGKSTLAATLAERLDAPFLEGDAFHPPENVARMREGTPLRDEDRWPWLDRLGAAAATSVREHGMVVLACSSLRRTYRVRLAAAVGVPLRFVMLDTGREELVRRLERRRGHYMPVSLLDSQLAALERPANDEDAITLDAQSTLECLVETTWQWMFPANPMCGPNERSGNNR